MPGPNETRIDLRGQAAFLKAEESWYTLYAGYTVEMKPSETLKQKNNSCYPDDLLLEQM